MQTTSPGSSLSPEQQERAQLLAELSALETPELLALCRRQRRTPERLGTYLALLRSRPGSRAQFAACLICFDLARMNHEGAQRELAALAPTILELARDERLVAELLAGDPLLDALWTDCRTALEAADPRDQWATPIPDDAVLGEIDLLSDLDVSVEAPEIPKPLVPARRQWVDPAALEGFVRHLHRHLGHDPAHGKFQWGSGFATSGRAELDRLEAFLRVAVSYASFVPAARGLACLGHLFLAVQLRRKSFFGRPNPRRNEAVRKGLSALPDEPEALAAAAAIFDCEGVAEPFQKVVELLIDFIAFCSRSRIDPLSPAAPTAYLGADREPPRVLLTAGRRRR